MELRIRALEGVGEVVAGDDLVRIAAEALARADLRLAAGDVLVVAQKIVSKAEGRAVRLADVTPSAAAVELATTTAKDPRLVELILSESTHVLRAVPGILIVRHRLGFVSANAGIDQSNLPDSEQMALLLPTDPDLSAARLADGLLATFGVRPAVLISDSFGRAWRTGTVNVTIGSVGFPTVIDRRGERDRNGRILRATEIALADAIAAAAGAVMGEAAEGRPIALVSGLTWQAPERPTQALIRPVETDLFL